MLTAVVIVLIGGGVLFFVKQPLRLHSSAKANGRLLACSACGNFFASTGAADQIVRCTECGTYARVDPNGAPMPIAPDFVAPSHVFDTYLPEAPRWPASCCVCGGPATHSEAMSITYAAEPTFEERMTAQAVVGVASLGTMRVAAHHVNVTERYKVPHCDEHAGGAMLVPAGVSFRSYGYYQQFVQANRATVGG